VTANKANAVVLWDGRTSLDVVPIRCVELDQSWDFPEPNTDCEPRRRIHLAFAVDGPTETSAAN